MLEIRNLDVTYGDRRILQDISFEVNRGEMVGILGPNGSGKTTLVLSAMGLLPPRYGSIIINGRPVMHYSDRERARLSALVPQNAGSPFPFPVMEVVLMGRYPHLKPWSGYTRKDRQLAGDAMIKVGIDHLAMRPFRELSGGESQGVLLARSFAQAPDILFLDEATSALDIRRKIQIFDLLARENRELGQTVIAVLHDINLAALYLDRLIFLKDGIQVAQGKTEEVLTPEVLKEVFDADVLVEKHPVLGRPQVVFLPGQG